MGDTILFRLSFSPKATCVRYGQYVLNCPQKDHYRFGQWVLRSLVAYYANVKCVTALLTTPQLGQCCVWLPSTEQQRENEHCVLHYCDLPFFCTSAQTWERRSPTSREVVNLSPRCGVAGISFPAGKCTRSAQTAWGFNGGQPGLVYNLSSLHC